MIRRFPFLMILLIGFSLLVGCSNSNPKVEASSDTGKKIVVYTTIYPLYDFSRNVAGDRAEVINLLPPGADSHHWEPTPGDLVKINQADVFVYAGAGLESWIEKVLQNTDHSRMIVVDSSKGIDLLGGIEEEHAHATEDPHEEQHDHSGTDPHLWLDPVNAASMVDNVLEGLVKADPANQEYYSANAQNYKDKLAKLDYDYKTSLSQAKVRHLVVSHAAFGYLTKRYGLEQVAIRGLSADMEPNPARLAEIVETVKKHKIRYIFMEAQISPKVSETLAKETGTKVLMLNHIGELTQKDLEEGKNYLSMMEENLINIKIACEVE